MTGLVNFRGWRARMFAVALVALLMGAPMLSPRSALAHPLGNFTTNRYARIEVYRDAIHLHYVLDLAEIPTVQLTSQADRDGDDALSSGELDAYAAALGGTLPAKLSLTLGGMALELALAEHRAELLPGEGGLKITHLAFVYTAYTAPVASSGALTVAFEDGNYADRTGWKEVVVRPSEGANVKVAPALLVDASDALRSYPAETLKSAPNVREVAFTWEPGTGAPSPIEARAVAGGSGRASSGFAGLLERDLSATVFPLMLLAAFGFGMIHALGPGHGKSVVAAYLAGSKGSPRHAVALGLTVTATHTSTVYLIGFTTLSASAFFAPDTLYLYLGVAAGLSIVLMGTVLMLGRLRRLGARGAGDGSHRHGLFGKAHSHLPNAVQSVAPSRAVLRAGQPVWATSAAWAGSGHGHPHGAHEHGHDHPHDHDHSHGPANVHTGAETSAGETKQSWRGLLTLGVIGGMLPCPSAIIVMLAAVANGQVLYGMLLIVAFSAGLAGVLTAIGLALVLGKRIGEHSRIRTVLARPMVARVGTALPVLSAAGVTIAGLAITYQAFQQPGL